MNGRAYASLKPNISPPKTGPKLAPKKQNARKSPSHFSSVICVQFFQGRLSTDFTKPYPSTKKRGPYFGDGIRSSNQETFNFWVAKIGFLKRRRGGRWGADQHWRGYVSFVEGKSIEIPQTPKGNGTPIRIPLPYHNPGEISNWSFFCMMREKTSGLNTTTSVDPWKLTWHLKKKIPGT